MWVDSARYGLWLWELVGTSEIVEIFIRGGLSIIELVDEEKNPKTILGLCTLSLTVSTQSRQIN